MTNKHLKLSVDALLKALLNDGGADLSLLDSSGRDSGGSRYLFAAVEPFEKLDFAARDHREANAILRKIDERFAEAVRIRAERPAICFLTISYEFGALLENVAAPVSDAGTAFLNAYFYDTFLTYDYATRETSIEGANAAGLVSTLTRNAADIQQTEARKPPDVRFSSNFSRAEYIAAVEEIRERIRAGTIYQANLTQKITAEFNAEPSPAKVFESLRVNHPAAFAAFLRRGKQTIVSASPERFLKIADFATDAPQILAAPIKGTRRRGATLAEDEFLQAELRESLKDRAENVMIVDLLRNDLGRICEYGTVSVEKLCELETHETLHHLVSTVRGTLRPHTNFGDVIRAAFPCGSITGAPKIRAMQILNEIEKTPRNLSMGAIGYAAFGRNAVNIDLSVAIRTIVFAENTATFNGGGGITIDSRPADEYDEAMLKAKALINALQS